MTLKEHELHELEKVEDILCHLYWYMEDKGESKKIRGRMDTIMAKIYELIKIIERK